ncbi:DUF929 family protein [Cutibacterium equinum]|uniref:DUF929 family protein n=1 Tax=Cutibacterium equinum TaxID=3016342 RepID=A0ABY7QYQ4_9ACTN|nr:DUF929 family protein [Cutibacterium equinum]WCC80166.1 DUF929 family protein [Cutibacterium equinum]
MSKRELLRKEQERESLKMKRRKVAYVVVGVLVLSLIVVGTALGINKSRQGPAVDTSQDAISKAIVAIPEDVYDKVGPGSAEFPTTKTGNKPDKGGKVQLFYVGGEFCPFCAMERLPLAAALSRFGTFSGLKDILSSSTEKELPNIPTITFRNYKYSSKYVDLDAYELSDREGRQIASLPEAKQQIFDTYNPKKGIPFTYWGDITTSSPSYTPWLAGGDPKNVAKALSDPHSKEAQAIVGGANLFTAEICSRTGNEPANVCTSPGVKAAAKKLR